MYEGTGEGVGEEGGKSEKGRKRESEKVGEKGINIMQWMRWQEEMEDSPSTLACKLLLCTPFLSLFQMSITYLPPIPFPLPNIVRAQDTYIPPPPLSPLIFARYAASLMCAGGTSFNSLMLAGVQAGHRVAVVGIGGLVLFLLFYSPHFLSFAFPLLSPLAVIN
jgi:hypothetical protein